MKFTDFENEDALDLFADLLDPISNIASDEEFKKSIPTFNRMQVAQYLLRNHKSDIMIILARLNGTPVKEYRANAVEMLRQLLEIINDETLVQFFRSQGLKAAGAPSGSAMENIAETAET